MSSPYLSTRSRAATGRTATDRLLDALRRPAPDDVPGTRPWPLVGDLPRFAADPQAFVTDLHDTYGDLAAWSLGGQRQYCVFHPDDVATVLSATNFSLRKGFTDGFIQHADLLGARALPASNGDLWKRQRRLAQPAMHVRRITGYATTMVRYATELADQWQDGQIRDVHQDMVRLTAQIAVKSLFGAEVGHADGDAIRDALAEMARLEEIEYTGLPGLLPYWMPAPHRRRLRKASAHVERLIMRAVDRRRRPQDTAGEQDGPPDLLAMLLDARDEDGRPMDERQLRNEIHTLYVAGHATTANTLGFAFALLARHPDVLDRLHTELDEVLGDAEPGFDDIARLPFTEACVKETLRLFPTVAMLPRKANVTLELRGQAIPADAGIWVSAWVTHRDPRFWPEPTRFWPARWLDEGTGRIHRSAWFPFGGGQRICYGMRFALTEAVLILAVAARAFTFTSISDAPVHYTNEALLAPQGGAVLALSRRKLPTGVS
ncbi:cytochrome P450 [Micromonospora sp. R77]|uniref:cytochrome P450 n=1 Tax=Micromonospora sp. R77 TaxID=2925836 RepID=UPI001F602986|nr:cytochrome P450 [Micromonospora sp. R77]MCI4066211.1 cytochrome P450 [Micromonospora sp. R77]